MAPTADHPLATQTIVLASGEPLYHQGQWDNSVYIVESGHLKLEHVAASGTASIAAVLGAGEILGAGLGSTETATQTASAKGATRVVRYTADRFQARMDAEPALAGHVIRMLARRQEITERRLYALMTLDVRGRVAVTLLDLVGQAGGHCSHGHEVDVPLTQQELAELIGASRPVVSVELNELRREGLLDYTRGHICVVDLDRLSTFANRRLDEC
jgi:CRP/FNR family transcriptional regulator, cyclic AMP receptor protein|tara:strand:- start:855 stop:1499 length:645 start_codon:yes stop_codon:yes gene_type:complete